MLKRPRIAVLVSGGGTNLQALIDAVHSGTLKSGEIVLVISNKDGAYALERAKNAGIETQTILKRKETTQAVFEAELLNALALHRIDMIVLAGFLVILSAEFVSNYPDRIINVHPALIPSFCGKGFYGLKVHEAALQYGVKLTGATVHLVNEIPDGGRILMQRAVRVKEGDTPETLQRRVMEQAEWTLLPKAVEMLSKELSKERAQ